MGGVHLKKIIRMALSKKGYEILAQQIPPSPISRHRFLLTKKLKPDKIFSRSRSCAESSGLFSTGLPGAPQPEGLPGNFLLEAFAELTDGKRPKGGILGVVIHMSMRGFLFS